jgi:hypothetical protein
MVREPRKGARFFLRSNFAPTRPALPLDFKACGREEKGLHYTWQSHTINTWAQFSARNRGDLEDE